MSSIVTIKPKADSRKFFTMASQYQKIKDANGEEKEVNAGAYKGERFPNSRQMFRPVWSQSKRRWMLDGIEKNGKELNDLVVGSKLKFPKRHFNEGRYITEADLFDYADPFFCHRLLKVISKEGEVTLDKDRPMDLLILKGVIADPQFQTSGAGKSMMSSRVKYVVTDKATDAKIRKGTFSTKREAFKLFDALNHAKKIKIAIIMGLIVGEDIEPELLDDALMIAIEDDKGQIEGVSKQDFFINIAKVKSEELDFNYNVVQAKKKGHLRKRANGYELFGANVGKTLKQVTEYLQNVDNQDVLLRLEQVLEETK